MFVFLCIEKRLGGDRLKWINCVFFNLKNFLKDFIYLFLERGEGKEKERDTSMCGCLSHAPYWGPGPQPRRVP